eukprot:316954-Prorocentrum_minimum.AAC.4
MGRRPRFWSSLGGNLEVPKRTVAAWAYAALWGGTAGAPNPSLCRILTANWDYVTEYTQSDSPNWRLRPFTEPALNRAQQRHAGLAASGLCSRAPPGAGNVPAGLN